MTFPEYESGIDLRCNSEIDDWRTGVFRHVVKHKIFETEKF